MIQTKKQLLDEFFKREQERYHHGDGSRIAKEVGDYCHCHTKCEKCKTNSKPHTTCIHCKPEDFKEDEFTHIRKEIRRIVDENSWMHGEDCGWEYYGHHGYYCGCGIDESNKEETEELLEIFKKYKSLDI